MLCVQAKRPLPRNGVRHPASPPSVVPGGYHVSASLRLRGRRFYDLSVARSRGNRPLSVLTVLFRVTSLQRVVWAGIPSGGRGERVFVSPVCHLVVRVLSLLCFFLLFFLPSNSSFDMFQKDEFFDLFYIWNM